MAWNTKAHNAMKLAAMASLLLAVYPASAQTSAQGKTRAAVRAPATENDPRVIELQQRIELLEQKLNALLQAAGAQAAAPSAAPSSNQAARSAQAAPAAPSAPAAAAQRGTTTAARSPAPGTFEIDEAAAQRALERTLTQTGALLLPRGTIELTPSFNYARAEDRFGTIEQNEFSPRIDLRAGLPMALQLEASLPYNYVRSQTSDLGTGAVTRDTGDGIGDMTLGVAKTFLQEKGWQPDLIGRVNYNFGNGKRDDGDVNLNAGFRQLSAELVALKRQDPLAFTASIGYGKVFEEDSIRPGDFTTLSLGALLAASPATSLQMGFTQVYREEQEVNGARIRGTDQTYGILNLGASSVLSRDVTLVTQFGIGLGDDAPKYSVSVALPILFR
ncbi:transporter [Oxalobacteraceae bacterium R-40]|uniref:Transporter n=1 Tax=Keguizhuia sedimenti TaxID=3064264 RepID=A0ABU1BLF2_9BURK|nr:transporter [Oxalobacteraceae bacterium R-40]